MSRFVKSLGIAALLQIGAIATHAQSEMFPDYSYDTMTAVSLANTADKTCEKIETSPKGMNRRLTKMITDLQGEGISPAEVTPHFETEYGVAQLTEREQAFRLKHSIGPENDAEFCAAIKAESKEDRSFRKLMKIRR